MRKRIAILFGGRSAEHEVSVISAGAVQRALDPERYEPLFIGITKEGAWHLLDSPPALAAGATELPAVSAHPKSATSKPLSCTSKAPGSPAASSRVARC